MKAFHGIRLKIAHYQLRQSLLRLNRKKGNLKFDQAKNIGLLFDPTDDAVFEEVKKFIRQLREQKKMVKSIGFFNLKQVPAMQYSKLEYDFISQKELNWWYKPNDDFIPAFLEEEFDVLINLSMEDYFPLHYIAALSRAKVKIGPAHHEGAHVYDLMLDISSKPTLNYFIQQLNHYLPIINRQHDTA